MLFNRFISNVNKRKLKINDFLSFYSLKKCLNLNQKGKKFEFIELSVLSCRTYLELRYHQTIYYIYLTSFVISKVTKSWRPLFNNAPCIQVPFKEIPFILASFTSDIISSGGGKVTPGFRKSDPQAM